MKGKAQERNTAPKNLKVLPRCPVSSRQAISRFKITPSYIV